MHNNCLKTQANPIRITQEKRAESHSQFDERLYDVADVEKYANYNFAAYKNDINCLGLEKTWENINAYILYSNEPRGILEVGNLSKLYEIGLELENKQGKKESGQYYTPDDVAVLMSGWFKELKGYNICDVGCGTGKLILTYLEMLRKDEAVDLIKGGRLYLYDSDATALSICRTIILAKYGLDLSQYINDVHCDFLSQDIVLPNNCKVISNPPYYTVRNVLPNWDTSLVAVGTKELYAMFMEKIIKQSVGSVILSPYSFIGGNKYYELRLLMNEYNGFIVSFDNVPGNIFCGKKHGVFNTNQSNSVRAAITVVENRVDVKGFRLTPLIRFKNEERNKLLKINVLENFIGEEYQIVDKNNPVYCKCPKELKKLWDLWKSQSVGRLCDYVNQDGKYMIAMPNTCRYYTTAASREINRKGQIILYFNDRDVFSYVYCLINSSFVYWYWRMFDGGITYPKALLLSVPVFFEKLSSDDKKFFNDIAMEMISKANDYTITKKNIGIQENIKYPREYRDRINERMLDILGNDGIVNFDIVHSNKALGGDE